MTAVLPAVRSWIPGTAANASVNSCATVYHHASKVSQASRLNWYNQDIWTSVMSFMDGRSLMQLALVNRQFYSMVMDDSVWKALCIRDLQFSVPEEPRFSWRRLYIAAVDGCHAYSSHNPERHIDWMRVGAFCIESGEAIATDTLDLTFPLNKCGSRRTIRLPPSSQHIIDVKRGPWIADLHLVRCPVCNLSTCEGTMQTLDARHWELFLHEEHTDGTWKFEEIASHTVRSGCKVASAGIFDASQMVSSETLGVLDLKSWVGAPGDWQPKGISSCYSVGACTNLQPNEGLQMTYHVMRAGEDAPVVGIRVSQQLI